MQWHSHFLRDSCLNNTIYKFNLWQICSPCDPIWRHVTSLTHWGRVTHICVSKLTIIGSDNGLSPERHQAVIWTNAGILLNRRLGTNFSEILIGNQTFSFKKMHLEMSSAKWRPFCLGLNVLTMIQVLTQTYHLTQYWLTVYPKKYAHGFVVLCFVVVMQSFIMNSYEVLIHIHQGCFAGTGAIVRLPQCQWSKPDGYGKISRCITTAKHSKAKTVCIFLGIYCITNVFLQYSHGVNFTAKSRPNTKMF